MMYSTGTSDREGGGKGFGLNDGIRRRKEKVCTPLNCRVF